MNQTDWTADLAAIRAEVEALAERVARLERRDRAAALPATGLLSQRFLTRAFTVLGHYLVAALLTLLVLLLPLAGAVALAALLSP